MVASMKVEFQASNAPCTLGSSNTNCYSYRRRLYRIKMIICSNKWYDELYGSDLSKADIEWINDNSVVTTVWPGFFSTPGLIGNEQPPRSSR